MSVRRHKKRKFIVTVTMNADSLEPIPELSKMIRCENRQLGPSIATTLIRTAKAKVIAKFSEVVKTQKHVENEMKSKDTRG